MSSVLPNDDTPGVGPDDYDRWRANFGASLGAGSGAGGTGSTRLSSPKSANAPPGVPEPSTLILITLGLSLFARRV